MNFEQERESDQADLNKVFYNKKQPGIFDVDDASLDRVSVEASTEELMGKPRKANRKEKE